MKKSHLLTAILTSAALSMTSCMTTNPYTGQATPNKTTIGAGLGALTGALGGLAVAGDGKSRKYAARGAVAGALAGAGIGYYMDRQEAAIRQELQGSGISVTRDGNNLILNMPSDITFDVAQSAIKSQFSQTLSSVALVLKKYDKTSINVNGHTDSDGSNSYNQGLSQSRALSVADTLRAQGVEAGRIIPQGYGESQPIASNSSSAGKAQNRRVELRITPQQSQFSQ